MGKPLEPRGKITSQTRAWKNSAARVRLVAIRAQIILSLPYMVFYVSRAPVFRPNRTLFWKCVMMMTHFDDTVSWHTFENHDTLSWHTLDYDDTLSWHTLLWWHTFMTHFAVMTQFHDTLSWHTLMTHFFDSWHSSSWHTTVSSKTLSAPIG